MFEKCTNITFFDNSSLDICNVTPLMFLEYMRGHQQLPLEISVPLTIINVIIFVTGLIGNIAVCVVIVKHRSMHTATNYYLFNLAVSDLTLLVFGLPNDVSVYWHQYPWTLGVPFCKLRALMSEMASYASVLTIVSFSTERYISICYPLYIHKMSGLRRALRIIACLWVIAFLAAAPFSLYTTVNHLTYPPKSDIILEESAFCGMLSQPDSVPLAELSTLLFFILPMCVLVVQYSKMGLQIHNSSKQFVGTARVSFHRDSRRVQSHRTVVRMLAAVVIAFFICWAPFHCQRLMYLYGKDWKHYLIVNEWMFYITGILYYLSSTLNPLLYNVMSARYRKAFRVIICGQNSTDGSHSTRCSQLDNMKHDQQYFLSRRGSRMRRSILLDTDDGCSVMSRDGAAGSLQNSYLCAAGLKPKLHNGIGKETCM